MPKALNHSGKLVKEISKTMNLKPAEIKQLKVLADGQDVGKPLVLLLCPSLLSQGGQAGAGESRPQSVGRQSCRKSDIDGVAQRFARS